MIREDPEGSPKSQVSKEGGREREGEREAGEDPIATPPSISFHLFHSVERTARKREGSSHNLNGIFLIVATDKKQPQQ